jgi:glutathione S-transferase
MPSLKAHSIESLVNDVPEKPTLFIVEGRYQNWIKPLIILEALHIPHDVICLAGLPAMKTDWYRTIHPQRMVPAFIDRAVDNENERIVLWDSAAMMTYLTDRYDPSCLWTGSSSRERVEVLNWVTFATASLW